MVEGFLKFDFQSIVELRVERFMQCVRCNVCDAMCVMESVRYNVDSMSPYFLDFATYALYNMCTMQHVHFACCNVQSAKCNMNKTNKLYESAKWIRYASDEHLLATSKYNVISNNKKGKKKRN